MAHRGVRSTSLRSMDVCSPRVRAANEQDPRVESAFGPPPERCESATRSFPKLVQVSETRVGKTKRTSTRRRKDVTTDEWWKRKDRLELHVVGAP
mmetsp:Transcript_3442/g.21561  ORF Transcript_3442/g.21561 Transcript_3442/m.21561 type:complete len:95 (+) Transcript_3442:2725-3009(+)